MTTALEGSEWSAARPGHTLPPGKTRYPFYRKLGGPQGRSGRGGNSRPHRDSIPDRPAHSQSLYRLRYSAHTSTSILTYSLPFCDSEVEWKRNLMTHGDAREEKWRGKRRMEWVVSNLALYRNTFYPALLPLMRTPRLPAAEWTDTPADINGLVRFAGRTNLVSARVPSQSVFTLHHFIYALGK